MTHTITLEIRQSVAAVEACKRAGIKHIVYSALDDLPEELHVPHYASKAKGKPYAQWFALSSYHI
jgi:hypothetical protein